MKTDGHLSSELDSVIAQSALVQYQPGSVVSRVLLKTSAGSVTAFAFAAGEGLSEHTTPFDALVWTIEGAAEISVGTTTHRLNGGQLLRLPAGQPHAVRAMTPFKMLLVMIRT